MIIISPNASEILRSFNMKGVEVKDLTESNPYRGKINQVTQKDKPLKGVGTDFGTPVVTNLTFLEGDYNNHSIVYPEIILNCVLVNVSQSKKIIKTELSGVDGTSKEYIGMGDYEISINGIINGPNGHYPIDEVNALHQVLKAPVAIGVVTRYLQNLDINYIVITDFAFDQEAGHYSQQKFSIQAVSDKPIEVCDTDFMTVKGGPLNLTFNFPK